MNFACLHGAVGLCRALALVALVAFGAAGQARAQAEGRAAPVTGPDVVTIGGVAQGSSVNVRSGPSTLFSVVGTLPWGTRVRTGICVGAGDARWCQIEAYDRNLRGFVSARFLVQGGPPSGGDGDAGPDFWVVRGLAAGDVLNVRREPSANAPALATAREGEILRNLGCRMNGNTRWCRVRSTEGIDVTGWVAARFLSESAAPGRPPSGGGSGASGPDFYVVAGLPAGRTLGLRTRPAQNADIIAGLGTGTRLQNLGCEVRDGTRWCRVRTTGSISATGWVNGRYLREG